MTTIIASLNQVTTTPTNENPRGIRAKSGQEKLIQEIEANRLSLAETDTALEVTLHRSGAEQTYSLPMHTLAAVGFIAIVNEGVLNLPKTLTPVQAGYINSFAASQAGASLVVAKAAPLDMLDLDAVTASVVKLPSRADWLKLTKERLDLLELSLDDAGRAKIEESKAAIKAAAAAIDSLKAALKPVLAIKGARLVYNSGELARVELPLGEVSKVIALAPTLEVIQLVGKPIVADDFSSAMAVFETVPASAGDME